MKLDNRLEKILRTKPSLGGKLRDIFIDYPIIVDLGLSLLIIIIHELISTTKYSGLLSVDRSAIIDILNELISTSLSTGGFILAALAIVASIQVTVVKKEVKDAKSGAELFYNSKGYKNIINIYTKGCFVYLAVFILFTITRGVADSSAYNLLIDLVLFGVMMMGLSFIRCIYILWMLIKIRN